MASQMIRYFTSILQNLAFTALIRALILLLSIYCDNLAIDSFLYYVICSLVEVMWQVDDLKTLVINSVVHLLKIRVNLVACLFLILLKPDLFGQERVL